MLFRVTPQQFVSNAIRFSQLRNRELASLQQQISTGLRIHKPSDDPANVVALITNHASVAKVDVDLANINIARGKLNQSVFQLTAARDALSRARTRAQDGVQSAEPKSLAIEVQGILDLMLQIANAADGGHPLFGGTSSALQPFMVTDTDTAGRPASVQYEGAHDRASIVIGTNMTVDTLYSGAEVFESPQRGKTIYIGSTGAAAGLGTDSAVGNGALVVRHTLTDFEASSGLQPGASSAQDTIIGKHELTIDATSGTVSLDGGSSVAFTSSDTDLKVTGPRGQIVHVDMSALAAGVDRVEITGHGTLSVDNGATETAIDFSANQVVIDSESGRATNVDSSVIFQVGVDHIEYAGTSDIFQTLMDLRDDLLNTRDLQGSDWQAAIQRRIGDIDRIHDHILEFVGEQSAYLANLDSLQTRAEDYQLETQRVLSEIESVDVVEAALRLQQEQNALQFTYASSIGLIDTSILDFLR